MNELLVHFYRHNLWANLALLDVCATLGDEDLDASAPGAHGRVRDTLVHLLAAESRYVAALTDGPPDQTLRESDGFPGFDALRERARASGEALIAVAARARAGEEVRTRYQGEVHTLPVEVPLLQAINHATEHRTNVTTILSGRGIELPAIDSWAFEPASP